MATPYVQAFLNRHRVASTNGSLCGRDMTVDDEGRSSRRAMLEYKKAMRAADEARRQKEREEQRKVQAAKNAEQRAEAVVCYFSLICARSPPPMH